jgi:hypothetical protein
MNQRVGGLANARAIEHTISVRKPGYAANSRLSVSAKPLRLPVAL